MATITNPVILDSTGQSIISQLANIVTAINSQSGSPEIVTNNDGVGYKFSSGLLICTKTVAFTNASVTTPWGSCYESAKQSLGNWPVTFTSPPVVSVTGRGLAGAVLEGVFDGTASRVGDTYLFAPVSISNISTQSYDVIGIGLWK